MTKLEMKKEFWEAVEVMGQWPLEYRRSQFSFVVKEYKGRIDALDLVLIMAITLGREKGPEWFREDVPLIYRLKQCKKNRRLNLPKKTLLSLEKAMLGTKFSERSFVKSRAKSRNFTNKIEGL